MFKVCPTHRDIDPFYCGGGGGGVKYRISKLRSPSLEKSFKIHTYMYFECVAGTGTQTRRRPSGIKSLLYPSLVLFRNGENIHESK